MNKKTDTKKTPVILRRQYRNGKIIAIFPTLVGIEEGTCLAFDRDSHSYYFVSYTQKIKLSRPIERGQSGGILDHIDMDVRVMRKRPQMEQRG